MRIELIFTDDEARKLLESAGLKVEMKTLQHERKAYHNETEVYPVSVWYVTNPYTHEKEPMASIFKKHIEARKKQLFLSFDNRLDIYSLFNKK